MRTLHDDLDYIVSGINGRRPEEGCVMVYHEESTAGGVRQVDDFVGRHALVLTAVCGKKFSVATIGQGAIAHIELTEDEDRVFGMTVRQEGIDVGDREGAPHEFTIGWGRVSVTSSDLALLTEWIPMVTSAIRGAQPLEIHRYCQRVSNSLSPDEVVRVLKAIGLIRGRLPDGVDEDMIHGWMVHLLEPRVVEAVQRSRSADHLFQAAVDLAKIQRVVLKDDIV